MEELHPTLLANVAKQTLLALFCFVAYKKYSNCSPIQGDEKIGIKNHPNVGKSSPNSGKQKISASKRNLKVQNLYINHFRNLKPPAKKPIIKLPYLGEKGKKCQRQK